MKKALFLGAIFVLGVSGLIAQTPPPKPAAPKANEPKKADAKPQAKDEFVEAVNAALQSHPDIKAAEAEVLLAQAKLEQVKLKVTQQINALKQARDEAILDLEQAKSFIVLEHKNHDGIEYLIKEKSVLVDKGVGDRSLLISLVKQMHESEAAMGATKAKIQKLSAEIARLDAEIQSYKKSQTARGQLDPTTLKLQFTDDINLKEIVTHRRAVEAMIAQRDAERLMSIQQNRPKTGGVYDTLRRVIDNPVKYGPVNGVSVQELFDGLLRAAGVPLKIRIATRGESMTLPSGEMSLGAWFELILDEMSIQSKTAIRYDLYIREYGLLLTLKGEAPSDAITVSLFQKQIQVEEIEAMKKKIQAEEDEARKRKLQAEEIEAIKKKKIQAEEDEAKKKELPKK